MQVCKDDNTYVRANFTADEFHSKSYDAPNCHFFSDICADLVQAVRSHFGVPIQVTSTYRTLLGNELVNGASTSQHLTGNAIDFKFVNNHDYYSQMMYDDFVCKGQLYQELVSLGLKGIGTYKTFWHFDDGNSDLNLRPVLTGWDKSEGKYGNVALTTDFFLSNSQGCPSIEQIDEFMHDNSITSWWNGLSGSDEDGIKSDKVKWYYVVAISVFLALVVYGVLKIRKRFGK